MRLKYNVLWIDDNLSRLTGVKGDFEECNSEVGIETTFHDIDAKLGARETPEKFQERVAKLISEKFSDSEQQYELILVDLHLGPRVNGSEVFNGAKIIEIIRDSHNLYRPIIFYSSGDPESNKNAIEQLDTATKSSDIYGKSVFIVAYDQLSVFLTKIAKEMHEEEHKINHVRGLLMDQVSEIDANISYLIKKLAKKIPKNKELKIVKKVNEIVNDKEKSTQSLVNVAKDKNYDEIYNFLEGNELSKHFGLVDRASLLKCIIKQITSLEEYSKILDDLYNPSYGDNRLSKLRNNYAHQTLDRLNSDHNNVICTHIRNESRRQLNNILEIIRQSE